MTPDEIVVVVRTGGGNHYHTVPVTKYTEVTKLISKL